MGRKKLADKDYSKQRSIRLTDEEWEIFKKCKVLDVVKEMIKKYIASS